MTKEERRKMVGRLQSAYEQVGLAIDDLENDGPRYGSEAKRLESALLSLDEASETVGKVLAELEEAHEAAEEAEFAPKGGG